MRSSVRFSIFSVFAALAMLLCTSAALGQARTGRPLSLRLSGVATNFTANASTGVQFVVGSPDGASYRATGAFDGINLFGRFDLPGLVVPCHGQALCLQFAGDLELGGDRSGFTPGSRARFVLTIVVDNTHAHGVYHIAPLPGIAYHQYGTLTLFTPRTSP